MTGTHRREPAGRFPPPPPRPRTDGHLRVVLVEDSRPLVVAYLPAAGLDAALDAIARDPSGPGPDLDAAYEACGSPEGMAEGALLALAAVLRGEPGRHARDRLGAALLTAGSAIVRISRVRRTGVVRVSVHEHLGEPPSRTLDLALAASRAGCPVLSLLGDQATGSRRGA